MDPHTRRRRPPARTRAVVAVVTVASVTCAVLTVVTLVTPDTAAVLLRDAVVVLLRDAVAVLALAGTAVALRHHARAEAAGDGPEHDMWRAFSRALAVLTVGAVGQLVADAAAPVVPTATGPTVLGLAGVVAAPYLYSGLTRWNRYRTLVADPGDWLNGLSAVFVAVSAANLAVTWGGSAVTALPWWVLQGSLFRISAAVMLLGTTFTISALGGLQRDPRVWGSRPHSPWRLRARPPSSTSGLVPARAVCRCSAGRWPAPPSRSARCARPSSSRHARPPRRPPPSARSSSCSPRSPSWCSTPSGSPRAPAGPARRPTTPRPCSRSSPSSA
ncbi:hypothetical protein [Cellulomonas sp. ATA003]|uniref:hypothetical protein n=1 Tax=Cellulomonas sp. ATA003 TaxID=3073064 RepID=UPI002873170D|nr:hypothetical protein [Cellulomonas sp. ATA003]WNB86920.1 hypothetical protein REH70_07110 [Cellulomonas sp. ATA003]